MEYKKFLLAGMFISCSALADNTLTVKMYDTMDTGTGNSIGEITVSETPYGLLFTPHLNGLTPGVHGFHVHEKPSCMPGMQNGKNIPALMAGGHLDLEKQANILARIAIKGIWEIYRGWLSAKTVQPDTRYLHHVLNHLPT